VRIIFHKIDLNVFHKNEANRSGKQQSNMENWTEEEDYYIMDMLRVVPDMTEWDFTEIVGDHNVEFGTNKTEDSYKERTKKLLLEMKGNKRKTHMRWTEEEKDRAIEMIKRNPINPNWSQLSKMTNRPESSLQLLYRERVSPLDHSKTCIEYMKKSNCLESLLDDISFKCENCKGSYYTIPKKWDSNVYCDECHTKGFKDEIDRRWKIIGEYVKKIGKDTCHICSKGVVYDIHMGKRYHFDHLNMFEKADSICSMVITGIDLGIIYREIEMCQVVCISCHGMITELERKCGFIRIKNNMTRDSKKGADTSGCQMESKKIYMELMEPIYELLRMRYSVYSSSSSSLTSPSTSSSTSSSASSSEE
jgi:hypothetical protein